jgi:hypothetical protein
MATAGNLLELFSTGRPTGALVLDTVHPAQGYCAYSYNSDIRPWLR